ncbi:MAG: peptidoglycan DD-metalloendopeptidase family protein [Epsilonproteobacteria bacterium]|nr:peptidoglycan DD-metalloendopeptidase family protein [Campylobacterota bacterium]
MNNHFTLTIHDDNGVKQFNLHKFVKKVILYTILFFLLVAFIATGTILYLNDAVDDIEAKRLATQSAYEELLRKNESIHQEMEETKNALEEKKSELTQVSDSLSEIEVLIGLTPAVNESSLQERVNSTKVSSEQMATLLQMIPSGSPIEYKGVTSSYGYRIHPTLNRKEYHRGIDLRAEMNTPVFATADGIIEYSGYHEKSGFGKLVIVRHNYGFTSYYGHLNRLVIKSGQFVKKGDLIAYSGNSGLSSGPHLHYELRFIGRVLNPLYFVKWSVNNYHEIFEKEKSIPWQSLLTATAHIKVPNPTQVPLSSPPELLSRAK